MIEFDSDQAKSFARARIAHRVCSFRRHHENRRPCEVVGNCEPRQWIASRVEIFHSPCTDLDEDAWPTVVVQLFLLARLHSHQMIAWARRLPRQMETRR